MTGGSIEARIAGLRARGWFSARAYALVDALLCGDEHAQVLLQRQPGAVALFDHTEDAALADAGPWLLDPCVATPEGRLALQAIANGPVGLVWLLGTHGPEPLAQLLRERLNVRLPGGATALLRFYDPRRLGDIARSMSGSQRAQFLAPALQWLVERGGQLEQVAGVGPDA